MEDHKGGKANETNEASALDSQVADEDLTKIQKVKGVRWLLIHRLTRFFRLILGLYNRKASKVC